MSKLPKFLFIKQLPTGEGPFMLYTKTMALLEMELQPEQRYNGSKDTTWRILKEGTVPAPDLPRKAAIWWESERMNKRQDY